MPDPLFAVLAGGAASRMGFDKALAEVAGVAMLTRVLETATALGLETVVAGPPRGLISADYVSDGPGMAGPAAGLAAVFRHRPGRAIVLVATDQPFLRPDTIAHLLATEGDAVVPVDGRRQTLCAVYRPPCSNTLDRVFAARHNPSLQTLLDGVDATEVAPETWTEWGEDGRSWLSIDTPEGLEAASETWPNPPAPRVR